MNDLEDGLAAPTVGMGTFLLIGGLIVVGGVWLKVRRWRRIGSGQASGLELFNAFN